MIKLLHIALLAFSLQSFAKEKVVSVSSFATEILYELNLENQLTGVDLTSQFPPKAQKLPNVGYKRTLALEGILSLSPTVIIMDETASPQSTIEGLVKSGVKTLQISETKNITQMKQNIHTIANFFKTDSSQIIKKIEKLENKIAQQHKSGKKIAFISKHGGRIETSAGKNTSQNEIITLLGATNAFTHESHRPINKEAMATLETDYIIYSTTEKLSNEEKTSIQKQFFGKKIIFVQSLPLLNFGIATLREVLQLSKEIK